jgi:hypothetical protein
MYSDKKILYRVCYKDTENIIIQYAVITFKIHIKTNMFYKYKQQKYKTQVPNLILRELENLFKDNQIKNWFLSYFFFFLHYNSYFVVALNHELHTFQHKIEIHDSVHTITRPLSSTIHVNVHTVIMTVPSTIHVNVHTVIMTVPSTIHNSVYKIIITV